MNDSIVKKKFPLWVKLVIVLSALPVAVLPIIVTDCSASQYEEIRLFIMIYPLYVVASAVMAWVCYRQRPEISIILVVLMILTHIAMWMLPGVA